MGVRRIIPLCVGLLDALPKQTCMYRMHRDVTYKAPCIMWYLAGTEDNIVVDLGPPDPDQVMRQQGFLMHRNEAQQPLVALAGVGVDPGEVKTVIVTHLHWDHAWGFDLFPNASFVIQRKEMQYASAPLPSHRPIYWGRHLERPQFMDFLSRITIIDGDREIEPGVQVALIPGHTPGFQGAGVDTDEGTFFIAGDSVGLYECWESDPRVPSGIFNSLEDCYASLDRIARIADHVLPGHDARVFDRPSYP